MPSDLREVDPSSVPPEIRTKALQLREVEPGAVPPEVRIAAEKARVEAEAAMTPEQRYEHMISGLPSALKYVAPGTMGEAAYMAGALGSAVAPAAPGALGPIVKFGLPIAAAAVGGAFEDPNNRMEGASREALKAVGQELVGGVLNKGVELGARFLNKSGILEGTASRIGNQLPSLFYKYPLKSIPQSAKDIEDTVAGNKLIAAAGRQIDQLGDALEKRLGKYQPAVPSKLVPASSGVATHYTPAIPAQGTPFMMPDIASDGSIVMHPMGIKEAINHVRELQAAGTTATGVVKRSAAAPLTANLAAQARSELVRQLNQLQPGLGETYRGISTDYGLARQLQKTFAGGFREDRQLDQPKLLGRARTNEQRIDQLKPGVGQQLREAISPTGESAVKEMMPGPKAHMGEGSIRAYMHFPHPYKPETSALLPFYARFLAQNPQLRPLLGALGYQAVSAQAGDKEQ